MDFRGGYPCPFRHYCRIITVCETLETVTIHSRFDKAVMHKGMEHAECNDRLSAWAQRQPLVALRCRETEARPKVHSASHRDASAARPRRAKGGVLSRQLDGRAPGLEEVCSEGEHDFGRLEVIDWQVAAAEAQLRGSVGGFFVDSFIMESAICSPGLQPALD